MTTERQRNLDLLYELGGERFTDWDVHCSKLSTDRHTDTRPLVSVLVHTDTTMRTDKQTDTQPSPSVLVHTDTHTHTPV